MIPVTNAITRRCTWRESLRCSSISSLASRRRLSVVLGWVLSFRFPPFRRGLQ